MNKRYEEYKPTEVEWLGAIPTSWAIKRLKHAVKHYKAGPFGSSLILGLLPNKGSCKIYSPEHLVKENVDVEYFLPDERISEMEQYSLKKDDVVIPIVGTLGRAMIYTDDMQSGIINQRLCKISPDTNIILPQFLLLLLKGWQPYQEWFSTNSRGAILDHITKESILQMPVALPSLEEQRTIVSFVQDKNVQVDQLIAQKQQMLELLREERTALINHAVTKGLDAAAPLRDSGVEWLGEVPAHWEVKRLKHLTVKIGSGVTPKGGAEVYQQSGIPILRSQNIHFDGLRLDDVAYIEEEVHNSMNNSKVLPGDVLLNITGASIGRCYFADETLGEANVNQHVCIVRPNKGITTRFLWAVLSAELGQEQIEISQNGSGREGLNFENLKKFVIGLPPIEEQQNIMDYLATEGARIAELASTINQEITLLQEYRAALIAEAVTGQIDVRDYEPVAQEVLL